MDEKRQTVTEQLDALIAEYNGSARDALNHTLAKLEAAQAELAQLRAERDAAEYLLSEGAEHAAADMDGEAQRWKDEAARLRGALEWYADERVWMVDETGLSRAAYEGNTIARAALEVKP